MGPLIEGSGVPYFYYDREYQTMILAGRGDNAAGVYVVDKANPQILSLLAT